MTKNIEAKSLMFWLQAFCVPKTLTFLLLWCYRNCNCFYLSMRLQLLGFGMILYVNNPKGSIVHLIIEWLPKLIKQSVIVDGEGIFTN